MTAHKLPPAAIHRDTAVSWGPRTKTKAARVHTVTAELAMTTQDSNRITILTRHASLPSLAEPPDAGPGSCRRFGDRSPAGSGKAILTRHGHLDHAGAPAGPAQVT
jgi:hypothetical protein